MLRRLLLVAGLFAVLGGARADMYTVRRQGAMIVPQKSTDVSMDAETVTITRGEYGFETTAVFVMRNQSDATVASLIAFPVVGASYAGTVDVNREFKVRVKDGHAGAAFVPVQARLENNRGRERAKGPFDFDECVVWDVTWAPGETKTIEVAYELGEPIPLPGSSALASGWQLTYVVRTGALWKGPIGRADIVMKFPVESWGSEYFLPLRRTSYPEVARWDGLRQISWHFENWTPTDDIWVRSAGWGGFEPAKADNFFVQLPTPYAGDTERYSEATLDRWIDRQLVLAKEYFPAEAAALDRQPLREVAADWLLHELLARHGDPFFIGKHVAGQPAPAEARGYTMHDNNYIGLWRGRFNSYGGMKGWYRPTYNPDGTPPTIQLTGREQENAEFLRGYLARRKP